MARIRPKNERLKREYRRYLQHANGKAETTIRQAEKSITRYEAFTGWKDFSAFDQQQAVNFKQALAAENLAPATTFSILKALKRFLAWLALQPGYKTHINLTDIEYLNLSDNVVRAAKSSRDRSYPSLELIKQAVAKMPAIQPIELRNRALIALLALTGIRIGALISLKRYHIDLVRRLVLQNPNEVATKKAKRINTFLPNLDDNLEAIVCDWVRYHEFELAFSPDDPLFPAPLSEHDADNYYISVQLSRNHWHHAQPVRKIVRDAFEAAGLPYYPPHSFRHMLAHLAYRYCSTPEEFVAWSQNFGHQSALTTITSYGRLPVGRQGEILRSLRSAEKDSEDRLATVRDLKALAQKLLK